MVIFPQWYTEGNELTNMFRNSSYFSNNYQKLQKNMALLLPNFRVFFPCLNILASSWLSVSPQLFLLLLNTHQHSKLRKVCNDLILWQYGQGWECVLCVWKCWSNAIKCLPKRTQGFPVITMASAEPVQKLLFLWKNGRKIGNCAFSTEKWAKNVDCARRMQFIVQSENF